MSSSLGRYFRITSFGESHGAAVGVVVDGVPAGMNLNPTDLQRDLDRRRPGTSTFVSPRSERDRVEILSGIADGKTLGTPIALLVWNEDARSSDYGELEEIFRPGHADFTYFKKYGTPPQPGGGRASGRETVGRVAAGAVARILLKQEGMTVESYTVRIGDVRVGRVKPSFAEENPLRCADPGVVADMESLVEQVRSDHDSVGGVVEVVVHGAPAGLGDPVFSRLDGLLAGALMSIGAVKGVEFGAGFTLAAMRGSHANDRLSKAGFLSNTAGGILGGISTGQPIVMRLAIKPTPSIGLPQSTVDIHGNERNVEIRGRHDPCLCPRIGPVAEAMTTCVLADCLLAQRALTTRSAGS